MDDMIHMRYLDIRSKRLPDGYGTYTRRLSKTEARILARAPSNVLELTGAVDAEPVNGQSAD